MRCGLFLIALGLVLIGGWWTVTGLALIAAIMATVDRSGGEQ